MTQDLQRDRKRPVPPGARLHALRNVHLSDTFIRSLSDDGVSSRTIKSIKRDNERRARQA